MPPKRGLPMNILGLALALVACYGVAAIGGYVTAGSLREWYPTLRKPGFNPPNSVFGPVWTILYAMMAVSAWMVWRARPFRETRWPLALFGVHLLLNLGWSLIFFGLRSPGGAFAEIVVLWASIVAVIVVFWRIRPASGAMMIPYLGWVTFATVLNLAVWRLNS